MLPIGDRNPTRTTPFVNYALIIANVVAFVYQYQLMAGGGDAWVVPGYGVVATRLMNDPAGEAFTVLTSMFMHGGLMHLAGNMLSLHIFGDNVEDAVGHGRYLLLYVLCGTAGAMAQVAADTASMVPMIGASGAIAGVMGAYLVLYPNAPILVFALIFVELPSWVVAGFFFAWNLMGGLDSIGIYRGSGVAFFAHLGGFIAGLLLVRGAVRGRERATRRHWAGFRPARRR
jgi:membrane associated rhomboid family serine protease